MVGYLCILGCIILTVYGQLIIKWRMSLKGAMPELLSEKIIFLLSNLLDPFILSGLVAAFATSILWMVVLTKFEVSHAYPFMSLPFIFVVVGSIIFFGETFTWGKVLGVLLICAGIIVTVKVK